MILAPCLLAFLLGVSGCEKKKTAAQLTAEKEKVWRAEKKVRAAKAYQDLIKGYPEAPYVAEAKQRLQALGPIATPKPGTAPKK